MIQQKDLHDSQGTNFLISFYFFQKLDLSTLVDLENFLFLCLNELNM